MATKNSTGAPERSVISPTVPQITDFRIMRQTEVAPGWWGAPVEIGETGSATVADRFCTEQNAVTMDPNRSKRIEFYAEPIDATPVGEAPAVPLPPHVVRAVTRYEIATARFDELDARPASELSAAEFDAMEDAQQTIDEAFFALYEAGRLDLTKPAETAARYRWASVHCRRLVESADFEGCAEAQDEMRMCLCRLQSAGRLDLIGATA